MLVVTRRVNERILIGDDVIVEISAIHGAKVLIGIDAPQHVRIAREEIADPQPKPSLAAILKQRTQ